MKTLKIFFDVVVVAFILFTIFLLTGILDTEALFEVSTEAQALLLYQVVAAAGAGVMLLKLYVNLLYTSGLRHKQHLSQLKINELKADLYENRQAFRSNSYRQMQEEEIPKMLIAHS